MPVPYEIGFLVPIWTYYRQQYHWKRQRKSKAEEYHLPCFETKQNVIKPRSIAMNL